VRRTNKTISEDEEQAATDELGTGCAERKMIEVPACERDLVSTCHSEALSPHGLASRGRMYEKKYIHQPDLGASFQEIACKTTISNTGQRK